MILLFKTNFSIVHAYNRNPMTKLRRFYSEYTESHIDISSVSSKVEEKNENQKNQLEVANLNQPALKVIVFTPNPMIPNLAKRIVDDIKTSKGFKDYSYFLVTVYLISLPEAHNQDITKKKKEKKNTKTFTDKGDKQKLLLTIKPCLEQLESVITYSLRKPIWQAKKLQNACAQVLACFNAYEELDCLEQVLPNKKEKDLLSFQLVEELNENGLTNDVRVRVWTLTQNDVYVFLRPEEEHTTKILVGFEDKQKNDLSIYMNKWLYQQRDNMNNIMKNMPTKEDLEGLKVFSETPIVVTNVDTEPEDYNLYPKWITDEKTRIKKLLEELYVSYYMRGFRHSEKLNLEDYWKKLFKEYYLFLMSDKLHNSFRYSYSADERYEQFQYEMFYKGSTVEVYSIYAKNQIAPKLAQEITDFEEAPYNAVLNPFITYQKRTIEILKKEGKLTAKDFEGPLWLLPEIQEVKDLDCLPTKKTIRLLEQDYEKLSSYFTNFDWKNPITEAHYKFTESTKIYPKINEGRSIAAATYEEKCKIIESLPKDYLYMYYDLKVKCFLGRGFYSDLNSILRCLPILPTDMSLPRRIILDYEQIVAQLSKHTKYT